MVVGLIVVGLVSVGLPLLGFWLGGRSCMMRLVLREQATQCSASLRGRGMTDEQLARIRSAVIWGRRLEDPTERAAARCWAQSTIDDDAARIARHPGLHRALRIAVPAWGVAIVAVAVFVLVQGHHVPVFPLAWYLLFGLLTWQHRTSLRRAVRLNTDVHEPSLSS